MGERAGSGMKKGACVVTSNAGAPLQPRTVTNEVRIMLTAIQPHWQARLAADPADQAWIDADEQAYFDLLAHQEEARRYPYGRPEQDTGWHWETPT